MQSFSSIKEAFKNQSYVDRYLFNIKGSGAVLCVFEFETKVNDLIASPITIKIN